MLKKKLLEEWGPSKSFKNRGHSRKFNSVILEFSAALSAPPNSIEQINLVHQILDNFTKQPNIVFNVGPNQFVVSDFNSLLRVIQIFQTGLSFNSSLTGSFSVLDYEAGCGRKQSVTMHATEYIIHTSETGQSELIIALDVFKTVRTKKGFKIDSLVFTLLTDIPLNVNLTLN